MPILRRAVLMMTSIVVIVVVLTPPAAGRTEGPLTAQVVDGETGKPIAGVVVVALYQKKTPGGVHPNTDFYDLDETATDADGRFSFPARELPTSTPLVHVIGPEMIIFKAGYAGWRFQGVDSRQHVDPGARDAAVAEGWRKFRTTGVVIETTPVKSRDDRSVALGRANYFPPIPEGRAPLLRRALDEEGHAIQKLR